MMFAPHLRVALRAAVTLLGTCLATAWLAACATTSAAPEGLEPDPVLAVQAYRDALVEGRPRDAFTWIHPDAREGLDLARFESLYRQHKDALVTQAEELLRLARSRPPAQRARVTTDRGDVLLERGDEGWRLLAPVGHTEPEGALAPPGPAPRAAP